MQGKWDLLRSRVAMLSYLTFATRTYRMPDGSEADWDIMTAAAPGVHVLALTPDRNVIMVRQYRPGPDRVLTELPGGWAEAGEDAVAAAARELREETGYEAARIVIAGSAWLAPWSQVREYAALALGCEKAGEPDPDALEFIDVVTMPLAALREHVRTGDMTNAGLAWLALDALDRTDKETPVA